MRITKLDQRWGAAYEEAQPYKITHGDHEIEVYVSENHTLMIELPPQCRIVALQNGKLQIEVEG
jgi:hypothetical protein